MIALYSDISRAFVDLSRMVRPMRAISAIVLTMNSPFGAIRSSWVRMSMDLSLGLISVRPREEPTWLYTRESRL